MKKIFLHIFLLVLAIAAVRAQNAGSAGAFARLGYGARGMGMGNALTAVGAGDISSYYNPALSPYAQSRTASATFGMLSLDRYLNFLSFTMPLHPHAGFSVGIINSGVRNIDGRDNDGYHTEDYSTTENQAYLSFANSVDEHVSLGVTIKLYYSRLFDKLTSTTVGFDAGTYIRLTDELSLGAVIQDINSKYKWDTKSLYGQNGKPTEDKFPNLRRIALAYRFLNNSTVVDAEFENSSEKTNIFRIGAEYTLSDNFVIRGGADRIEFNDNATGVKPSFGFTAKNSFNGWTPAITYAFVIEGYAPRGMHIITLSGTF